MQIYVSGSVAYDRVMNFPGMFKDQILPDQIHNLNVSFMVDSLIEQFGGTAGNIAYNLMLLEENPVILASAGSDFSQYEKWLHQCRLSTKGIRRLKDTFTPGCYLITDQANNQINAFNLGAMQYPSKYDFNGLDSAASIAIVAPGNQDDMRRYSQIYEKEGVDYIFDPGQVTPTLSGEDLTDMITGCRYLISNGYELEMIKKSSGLTEADFLDRCDAVITTFGADGSVLMTKTEKKEIPSVTVDKAVDPTGAGDAFRAGLIKGIVTHRSLLESVQMGAVCASFAVEKAGTQVHRFTMEAFKKRLQRTFG